MNFLVQFNSRPIPTGQYRNAELELFGKMNLKLHDLKSAELYHSWKHGSLVSPLSCIMLEGIMGCVYKIGFKTVLFTYYICICSNMI